MPFPIVSGPESDAPAWVPTLEQVAVHVPWLTIPATDPGAQEYLNTFTDETQPDADVAWQHIADAVSVVGAGLGELSSTVQPLATTVTALWAAATLAAAYARTPEDRAAAVSLTDRAGRALTALTLSADNSGAATLSAAPVLYAPEPVAHGDWLI